MTSEQIDPPADSNPPTVIGQALSSISDALTPRTIKALDRLLSSAVDIGVAKLQQRTARIEAQTASYKLVEARIAAAVASSASEDKEIVRQAIGVLVNKEYRRFDNRKAVAAKALEHLQAQSADTATEESAEPSAELDEDWLNVFERYAEDASSERLQGLWGKVLAGEIRRPGQFATRTLRFLSEVSQSDALLFEAFTKNVFGDVAPKALVVPSDGHDIRHLIDLESMGLIDGASGLGLQRRLTFDQAGTGFYIEGSVALMFKGPPNRKLEVQAVILTKLGQEVLHLVAGRDTLECGRSVARAIRTADIRQCYIGKIVKGGMFFGTELLWDDNAPLPPTPTT